MTMNRTARASRSSANSGSESPSRAPARLLRAVLMAGTALSPVAALAGDLPSGASVAHGNVAISTPSAGRMVVDQGSRRAIVNWGDFSVGSTARVDFRQPSAASAILNRVTGPLPSRIDGTLNANGQVFLVNPNGIAIGKGGRVNAAGFTASTLAIRDRDFANGRLSFSGTGASAAVRNAGTIEIGRGGYAALLGGRVENTGTIRVPMGTVGLGAGERAVIDLSGGDGFLSVAVPSEGDAGDKALIEQAGRIEADGGRVEMKAATARHAVRHAINMSGVVEARSVSGRNGAIVLGGGTGGRVTVSGRMRTSAPPPPVATLVERSPVPPARPQRGGDVTITGAQIALNGAQIEASGPAGGGTVRIGGDLQGGGTLPTAGSLAVDGASRIAADATLAGDGGTVILWADAETTFLGTISARGGPEGGD